MPKFDLDLLIFPSEQTSTKFLLGICILKDFKH